MIINFTLMANPFITNYSPGKSRKKGTTKKRYYPIENKTKYKEIILLLYSGSDIDLMWLQTLIKKNYPKAILTNFYTEDFQSTNATIFFIHIDYKNNPQNMYPDSLFLKICNGNNHFVNGSEYFYYTQDYKELKDSPLPVCYDAQYSELNGAYHILLEDLSKTHYSNKDVKPTLNHAFAVAKELARLHAFKWESREVTNVGTQISTFINQVTKGLQPILKVAKIPNKWENVITKVFVKHPELMKRRARKPSGLTLIHGDPNPTNILSPNKKTGKTYIIDRQPFTWSLSYWLGVYDLAYMIMPYWDSEDRRSLEKTMLREYHNSLLEFGVSDYSWKQCLEDYRLCVVHGIYVAIGWGMYKKAITQMRWLWEKQLQRSMVGFFDWECEELLNK